MSVVNSDSVRAGASGVIAGYTIDNSCVFDGAADYLTFTPSTPTDNNTWTFSCWLKIANHASDNILNLLDSTSSDSVQHYVRIQSNKIRSIQYDSGYEMRLNSLAVFRDPSAWYHIVFVMDTGNSTEGDRTRIYVNGVELTAFTTESQPSLNETSFINTASRGMAIGRNAYASGAEIGYMNGYLAEVVFIDGLALTASSFGETDDNGVWVPIDPSTLTFGANGFHLDFADSSALGNDVSGNNNDWTPSGLVAANQTTDSPTDSGTTIGNYATWNPLHRGTPFVATLSEGNKKLEYTGTPGSNNSSGLTTIPFQATGKFYAEILVDTDSSGRTFLGTVNVTTVNDGNSQFYAGNSATSQGFYSRANPGAHTYDADDGKVYTGDDAGTTYGATWTAGDIIGIYWNQGTVYFTKNEALQDSATEAEVKAGTTTNAAFTGLGDEFITVGHASDFTLRTDPDDWSYTPFSGFLSLCTANLAAPAIADPSAHMNAVIYTGNGSARDITFGGNSELTADYIVIKNRDQTDQWKNLSRGRGVTKELNWDDDAVESTDTDGLDDFGVTDGFGLGSGAGGYNDNTEKFVAFGWAANGTTGSLNEVGTIDSTVSVNDTAGFSIGRHTGTGSAGTLGHGLSAAPDMIIIKCYQTQAGQSHIMYHSSNTAAPETDYLRMVDNAATDDYDGYWNDPAPTSSVFSVGTDNGVNNTDLPYEWLCFRSIPGYSSFGSYVGNGNVEGPYIYFGFRPQFILFKCSSTTGSWLIFDAVRQPYNPNFSYLLAHDTTVERTTSDEDIDMLASGVKLRSVNSSTNSSGQTYVYAAFAENPFGGSGVAQGRAR